MIEIKSLYNKVNKITASDNAEVGWCARGVGNILQALDLPFERGDAKDYIYSLPQKGWVALNVSPEDAPPGAIIIEKPVEGGACHTKGDEFGHISMKILDANGQSAYASDKIRKGYDGSSRTNEYVVFVSPDFMGQANLDTLQTRITQRKDRDEPLWQQDGVSEVEALRELFGDSFLGQLFSFLVVASQASEGMDGKFASTPGVHNTSADPLDFTPIPPENNKFSPEH